MFIMVFSRLYFKIRPIKIVKYMFDKVFNLKIFKSNLNFFNYDYVEYKYIK